MMVEAAKANQNLLGLFARFLRFGLLAWGGPVAQIGMIRRELVDEQQWLDPARFNRLLAVYQVLPGPEAHELCVHLGMMQRGRLGGLAAGLGFMLPGLVLMLALSWLYDQLDLDQPFLAAALLGLQIGVVAIIVRAAHRIGAHVLEDGWLCVIAVGVGAAALAGVAFWITLPTVGVAYALAAGGHRWLAAAVVAVATTLAIAAGGGASGALAASPTQLVASGSVPSLPLFLSGLKAGLLTFGGAYTAIPFVRGDAGERGWVDDSTFLDGLALSQIIPAPLILFATFVGYQAGGLAGALAMTAGVFLPAFSFTLLFFDRLERVIEDIRLHRFLSGVAAGVVGLIGATTLQLSLGIGRTVPSLVPALLIVAGALLILYRARSQMAVPTVVLLSAVAGVVLFAR
jgi:chromate transporter